MKTIFNMLILCLIGTTLLAQSPYSPCYDPEWDWTKPENWKVYLPGTLLPNGTYVGVVNYPFDETKMNRDFRIILDNNDLSPDDGWVLIQKDLGCEISATSKPYVIFYNYYRGLIRVFALHTYNESASYGLLTVDWGSTNRTSALTYSNILSRANDKYPSYSDDMAMLQIENYANGQWWVSEFQVAFDHKTVSDQTGCYFNLKIHNVISSDIHLTSNVDLIAKSIEIKGAKNEKDGSDVNGLREWGVKTQKAVQKLNYDEWSNYLENTQEGITDVYWWATQQWSKNNTFEWLVDAGSLASRALNDKSFVNLISQGAKAAGAINSTLGFMVDFIDFFVGKPSASSSPSLVQLAPLQITGTITSTGTLKTTTQQQNYTLPLPGTQANFPYYTCPMGVLNLKETPTIDIRKWDENNKYEYLNFGQESIYERVEPDGYIIIKCSPQESYTEKKVIHFDVGTSHNERWKSLRLKEIPKIAINSASNLELVDAKIAFQGKIRKKSSDIASADYNKCAYNLFEQFDFLPTWFEPDMYQWSNYGQYCGSGYGPSPYNLSQRWINKTFDYLKNKTYFLIEGGEDLGNGNRNEFYKFRTEFVDVKDAKYLSFTVREETEVTMKLVAVFKEVNNENAPLMVFTNEYVVDEPETVTDTEQNPYPFIRSQVPNVDIYEGSQQLTFIRNPTISSGTYSNGKLETVGVVNVSTSGNVNFIANHSIVLKPGFHSKANGSGAFRAKIDNGNNVINDNFTSLNQIAKYYKNGVEYDHPVPCNCIPQSSKLNFTTPFKIMSDNEHVETILNAFPNPCSAELNIDYYTAQTGLSTLTILDLSGKTVFRKQIASGNQQIDISNLSQGVYLIRVFDGNKIIVKKIIKQ